MSSGGLLPRTKEWLFAIRAYYASDGDIVLLCEFTEEMMNRIEEGEKQRGTTTEEISFDAGDLRDAIDCDDWDFGGG